MVVLEELLHPKAEKRVMEGELLTSFQFPLLSARVGGEQRTCSNEERQKTVQHAG